VSATRGRTGIICNSVSFFDRDAIRRRGTANQRLGAMDKR